MAISYEFIRDPLSAANTADTLKKVDDDGNISFVHSSVGNRNFDVFEKGIMNLEPSPGLLVMFPSYLAHTVYPFIGEGERRCLPFNAVYRISDENKNFVAGDLSQVVNPTFYTEKKSNE